MKCSSESIKLLYPFCSCPALDCVGVPRLDPGAARIGSSSPAQDMAEMMDGWFIVETQHSTFMLIQFKLQFLGHFFFGLIYDFFIFWWLRLAFAAKNRKCENKKETVQRTRSTAANKEVNFSFIQITTVTYALDYFHVLCSNMQQSTWSCALLQNFILLTAVHWQRPSWSPFHCGFFICNIISVYLQQCFFYS